MQGTEIIDTAVANEIEYLGHKTEWYHSKLEEIAKTYDFAQTEIIGQSSGITFELFGIYNKQMEFYEKCKDNTKHDIMALDFFPSEEKKGEIVIVAGHHANEPAGPEAAIEFAQRYAQSSSPLAIELKKHYQLTIIPVIDVDQYARPINDRKYGPKNDFYDVIDQEGEEYLESNGQYIPVAASPEAKAVANAVKKRCEDAPLLLAFDLHETSNVDGFEIILNKDKEITSIEKETVDEIGKKFYVRAPRYNMYTEEWSYPGIINRDTQEKIFCDFTTKLGAQSYSFETPSSLEIGSSMERKQIYLGLEKRVEMDLIGLDGVISRYVQEEIHKESLVKI